MAKKSNCLYADYMILYVREPKDSIKRLLELVREFAKVVGYKTNEHNDGPSIHK